jgi:hypothetical protein
MPPRSAKFPPNGNGAPRKAISATALRFQLAVFCILPFYVAATVRPTWNVSLIRLAAQQPVGKSFADHLPRFLTLIRHSIHHRFGGQRSLRGILIFPQRDIYSNLLLECVSILLWHWISANREEVADREVRVEIS